MNVQGKKNTSFRWTVLFCAAVTCLILFGFLYTPSHPPSYHLSCASNLKEIGLALRMYSADNDESFPPDLYTLIEQNYIRNEMRFFRCPCIDKENRPDDGFRGRSDFLTDYWYYPGHTEDTAGTATGIVTDMIGNHAKHFSKGGNILFGDGHVRGYREKEWYLNSRQATPPPRNPRL